ncbi:hypothetical protein I656_00916 [Geobacillus sp. WSUCF1]|nr:hypothetical protein I656_00916 [Geobacillus sp. WSUCF1]
MVNDFFEKIKNKKQKNGQAAVSCSRRLTRQMAGTRRTALTARKKARLERSTTLPASGGPVMLPRLYSIPHNKLPAGSSSFGNRSVI